jgi:N-acetylmuramoyl-L-alanine amidase
VAWNRPAGSGGSFFLAVPGRPFGAIRQLMYGKRMEEFPADSRLVGKVRPSPNHDARAGGPIDILLLHYTGMASAELAIARLCDLDAKVSSHYVIDESGGILQLVPEARRAWHAGVSSWEDATDVNSRSIGIEIANPGHDFGYPDFPKIQINSVIALCADILVRRKIRSDRVLAHSDVAPLRKSDPGERFPWRQLHDAGVGAWVAPAPIGGGAVWRPGDSGAEVAELQASLRRYGYGIEMNGRYDAQTAAVVTAFQRHFRPARVDGIADRSTIETLQALIAGRGT